MKKTITSAIIYSSLILILSTLIITLSPQIHEKILTTDTSIQNDQVFTSYFQSGSSLEMANIKGITKKEIQHMFDVRKILIIASITALLLGIILLVLWESIQNIYMVLLSPLLLLWISIPTIFISNFNNIFLAFHKIIFPQGNYLFPYNSVLISTYSENFFMHTGIYVIKLYLLISIGFLFIKYIYSKLNYLIHSF